MEFSKGGSEQDFTAWPDPQHRGKPNIINLNNAYFFGIELEDMTYWALIKGPGVECDYDNHCSNISGKGTPLYEFEDAKTKWDGTVERKPASIIRREQAIVFIRKVCPGKAY